MRDLHVNHVAEDLWETMSGFMLPSDLTPRYSGNGLLFFAAFDLTSPFDLEILEESIYSP